MSEHTKKKEWFQMEADTFEKEESHKPITEEQIFFETVAAGDIDAVRKNCEEHKFLQKEGVGILSNDPITNIKYHFVVTAALMTRICIKNGLGEEIAFRLSDFYIKKLDNLNTIKGIEAVHNDMVIDFTGRMRIITNRIGQTGSVSESINYIYSHITSKITVADVAAEVGLSESYLSRLFKKEIGSSISDYIRDKKIDAAHNLLKYSDCSMIEIANRLAFSSQSHFIQTFKKMVGITPKKYRELYGKKLWHSSNSIHCP